MKLSIRPGLAATIVLIAGLTACSSAPPVRYHTLLAPAAQTIAHGEPAAFLIDVLPVGIPAQLDQPQLVVRAGDSSLALLDGERWAGPLSDELRNALSAQLTRKLDTLDIAGLPRSTDKPVLRIKLQVRRFDAWPGQRVRLDADWSLGLADETGNARLICHGQFDEPVSGNYPELVQAQQRALAALADRIATDARSWMGSRQSDCTTTGAVTSKDTLNSRTTP
ncbi:PqiC family protein [Oxalicibacterium solurbis]|uniref:Lipoprotein n=1 Tax=Oxalicibacterium solurbis TaxID=69280 RepID=A0A8J3F5A8_9BURK|nr:PqiC family protein [Oxalicibacterium solurbis]GGI53371.1 lipoprotein [Oxalicibacterium solurbis]